MNTIQLYKEILDRPQLDRELTMILDGYEQTFQTIDEGNESFMAPVLRMINDLTKDFSTKIEEFACPPVEEGVRPRRTNLAMSLDYIDASHLSYLTCRTMINALYEKRKRNSLGKQLSNVVVRNIKSCIGSSKKLKQEKKEALLAKSEKYHQLGYQLLQLFIDSYPQYIKLEQQHTKKTLQKNTDPVYVVAPTDEWTEMMGSEMEIFAFVNHSNKPMIRPPRKWNYKGYNGGYYSPELKIPIHKIHANKSKNDHGHSVASSEVIKAVNAIQETPWRVNVDVLDVLVKLADEPPATLKDVFPPQPEYLEKMQIEWMDKEDFAKLPDTEKRKLRNHADKIKHLQNRISAKKSVDISTISAIRQAKEYMNDAKIYFPYSIDYRGRIYSMAMSGLNPQGSDLSKGLLQLANGRPITSASGIRWYMVNLANLIGQDKLPIHEKVNYVHNHEQQIRAIANDPYTNTMWHHFDKPIQGLGACIEYVKWLDDPTMKVHTHVQLDGTCNGIQHLTVLSYDESIAPHVGLIPTETKGDIYQYVCDGVQSEIDRILRAGKSHDMYQIAQEWNTSGLIGRKLTKKPVMTRSYAATLFGIKEGVHEYILDSEKEEHFTNLIPSANFMGQVIWETMDKELYGAMAVMEWFKAIAKAIGKVEKPLTWSTPSGMLCYYAPRKTTKKQYKIVNNRAVSKYVELVATDQIDSKKLASSIAPNIIHSFDASHLVITTLMCLNKGIKDFAFVHDSFGTHPDDAQLLLDLTKEAFIDIYSKDRLMILEEEFRAYYPEADIPSVSNYVRYGDYSVNLVKASDYFFG